MFESVLIANRGEIAVRVLRTCRRLGLRTIVVYSTADAETLPVALADVAIGIGPAEPRRSYLDQASILAAARRAGAAAVHPGYGFLAEHADFARAVLDAGMVWVGPPPAAMAALGDKARARALAERLGVPVLPGTNAPALDLAELARQAAAIGYPLMVKAAAGGGGRGMRTVTEPAQLAAAIEAARREARGAFGDDRLLVERYVARPRHVEVQILGDQHGHLLHLGERECSVQRRHQKLLEETPSPSVSVTQRQALTEAALRLGRAAGYASAGTVEFLLDERGEHYFLEVNTRLQVEHPVTEMVTGLDLVEWQLRVAAGEVLPFGQQDVRPSGHALEARVLAEDPRQGLLPSSGRVSALEWPPDARIETWLRPGADVTTHYDSLLGKVVVHGTDRASACTALADALRETWIEGLATNLDVLLATVEEPAFRAGDLHTQFLAEHAVLSGLETIPLPVLAAAAAVDALVPAAVGSPWQQAGSWRQAGVAQPAAWTRAGTPAAAYLTVNRAAREAHVTPAPAVTVGLAPSARADDSAGPQQAANPGASASQGSSGVADQAAGHVASAGADASGALDRSAAGHPSVGPESLATGRLAAAGPTPSARDLYPSAGSDPSIGPSWLAPLGAGGVVARVVGGGADGGWQVAVGAELLHVLPRGARRLVRWRGMTYRLSPREPLDTRETAALERTATGVSGTLAAPMPGRVLRVAVTPGQAVTAHQPLLILEAMKMEHVVEAPHAGTVATVSVAAGDQVKSGQVLVTLASDAGHSSS